MTKTITAVLAKLPNKKVVYVASTSRRDDGSLIVETSFNKNDAKDYRDQHTAVNAIKQYHNPLHRDFEPVEIEIDTDEKTPKKELIYDERSDW